MASVRALVKRDDTDKLTRARQAALSKGFFAHPGSNLVLGDKDLFRQYLFSSGTLPHSLNFTVATRYVPISYFMVEKCTSFISVHDNGFIENVRF
jgi:hypothetical protein